MMEDIKITDKMIDYTKDLVLNKNFAHRGKSDGTTRQQFIGILAENYIRFILDLPLVSDEEGFDGGYDLIWNDMKVDVKAMERKGFPKPHYVNNVLATQMGYQADAFIFCSVNVTRKCLTICGWITKEDFKKKAKFYKQAEGRRRDDGTILSLKGDTWEIENKELNPFYF